MQEITVPRVLLCGAVFLLLAAILKYQNKQKALECQLQQRGLRVPSKGSYGYRLAIRRIQSNPWLTQEELDEDLAKLNQILGRA